MSPPLLASLSSFQSNPTEASMKSAALLLGCKTTVESSRENNGGAGALIHRSARMLGDLGLAPITYLKGGGGERWWSMSRAQRNGCVLHVHHLFSVGQAIAFASFDSHNYNGANSTLPRHSNIMVLTLFLCFNPCKHILSSPNSVFLIFLCLFLSSLSPLFFLTIFLSKLC